MPVIKAQQQHLPALFDLADTWDQEEESANATDRNKLEDYVTDGCVYIYLDEDDDYDVLGAMITAESYDTINLYTMYVHPDNRSEGIGGKLLDTLTEIVDQRHMKAFLEVSDTNRSAIELYERHGFELTDAGNVPHGHVCMERDPSP